MQHRQRRSFTHLDTGHHSYSPRHENRTCNLSMGFEPKPQLIELGPSLPKSNRWTEIFFVRWLVMKWGDHTAVVLLSSRHSAALVARSLSLRFVIYVSTERISLVNANTSSAGLACSLLQSRLPLPLPYSSHLFFLTSTLFINSISLLIRIPLQYVLHSILICFFSTSYILYSPSPLWFYFLPSHYPISFFCTLSEKMYLWIW